MSAALTVDHIFAVNKLISDGLQDLYGQTQKETDDKIGELNISFQVVDVHKPLLAVSSITAQGHKVIFADKDDHILLASGDKLPLRNVNGVFELDVWIKKDPNEFGFARQGR